MSIVKFKNGEYAIRRWFIFGYQYRDLTGAHWWSRDREFYRDCLGTLEEVTKAHNKLTDKGEEVK